MSRHIKTAEACPNEEKIIKREKILLHVSTLFLAPIWRISHVSLLFLKKEFKNTSFWNDLCLNRQCMLAISNVCVFVNVALLYV